MTKPREVNYERKPLGTVTRRTRDGRPVGIVARCPKCGRRGERSCVIPTEANARTSRPFVHVTHHAHIAGLSGFRYMSVDDGCTVSIDKTNADELLNVDERREYETFVAALRGYLEIFA